jgi:hypothetical protein
MAADHDDAPTPVKVSVPKLFLIDVSGPGFGDTSIHVVRSSMKGFEGSAKQIDPCFDGLFTANGTLKFDSNFLR